MATYTTEIRRLVESHFDLGLKSYPIFDESYRQTLNDKIINHYYFREIGFETAGLFKFYLNQKMAEIMPYYNQLYKSQLLEFNPFYNVDKTTKNDGVKNANSNSVGNSKTTGSSEYDNTSTNDTLKNGNTTNANSDKTISDTTNTNNNTDISVSNSTDIKNGKKVHSDTPQGLLNINSIENEVYASDADYNTDTDRNTANQTNTSNGENKQSGSTTTEGVNNSVTNETQTNNSHDTGNNTNNVSVDNIDSNISNSTESYLAHVVGKEGSETYSEMLLKYRDTFINIDLMIIDELSELFMNVY